MRVLLADDDSSLLGIFNRALLNAGYHVEVANDGHELLLRATLFAPDVVVSDIDLPGCDGIRACKLLKAARPRLRFILMTGAPESADRAREAGFSPVLLKPFDLNELKDAVASA